MVEETQRQRQDQAKPGDGAEGALSHPAQASRRLDKRDQILAAASRLFSRYSFDKVSMEDIGTSLELAPGGLYHHFEDKESLIHSCYVRGLEIIADEINDALEPGIDGLETIRRIVRTRLSASSPKVILFMDMDALSDPGRSYILELRRKNVEAIAEIVARGVEDGTIRSDHPMLTAIAIVSIVDWTPFWFSERDYYSHDDVMLQIDDMITHGVYRRGASIAEFPPEPDLTPLFDARKTMSKREAKLDALIRTASDLFNKKGARGASLEEVAQKAGLTRAGIYYHFKEKEQLLYRCLQRGLDNEISVYNFIEQLGTDPIEFEVQYSRALFAMHSSLLGPKHTYHYLNYLTPEHRRSFLEANTHSLDAHHTRLARGIESGEYRNVDINFAYRLKTGLYNWYPIWFRDDAGWSSSFIADHFTKIYLYGIRPRNS